MCWEGGDDNGDSTMFRAGQRDISVGTRVLSGKSQAKEQGRLQSSGICWQIF